MKWMRGMPELSPPRVPRARRTRGVPAVPERVKWRPPVAEPNEGVDRCTAPVEHAEGCEIDTTEDE